MEWIPKCFRKVPELRQRSSAGEPAVRGDTAVREHGARVKRPPGPPSGETQPRGPGGRARPGRARPGVLCPPLPAAPSLATRSAHRPKHLPISVIRVAGQQVNLPRPCSRCPAHRRLRRQLRRVREDLPTGALPPEILSFSRG